VLKEYQPSAKLWGGADGDTDMPEVKARENIWLKHAVTLLQEGIDPEAYVMRVFASIGGVCTSIPEPSQLLSRRSRDLYVNGLPYLQERERIAFDSQCAAAKLKVRVNHVVHELLLDEAILDVLHDGGAEISTLFRYCWASDLRKPAVYGSFLQAVRNSAAIAYWGMREVYDPIWGKFIPRELRDGAEAIYDEYLATIRREVKRAEEETQAI
jgi:hypothetical protein